MRDFLSPAGVLLPLVLAACAAAPGGELNARDTRDCFWANSVSGFSVVDRETINVRTGPNQVFQLKLFSPSPDIDWTEVIGIESRGSDWICAGLDATIIVPTQIGPQRFPVVSVRRLPPDEDAPQQPAGASE